ncbi:MAG: ribonucleotide-diphosphate reductase subunit beta [Actinomycetota bacterium]
MTDTTQQIVERVDSATLKELRDVDIEDVYVQMDETLKARPTPLDLYFRWERQNWSTQDLDFSEDRVHWDSMTGFFEGMRTELQRTFTLFFLGEQAVTDTLSPLVHAAPDEDSRNFLSTQLVDEARHSIFFSRFFSEVVGIEGGIHAALEQLRDATVVGYRELFDSELVAATEAVRENPTDYAAWVRGIATYHLVIEGMLALTGQRFLLGIVREMGILPGFYAGFTAVARDESRHVNFGVRALMEAGVRDRAHLDVVSDQILRLLPMACRIVAAPDRRFAVSPQDTPPNLHINPYDVREFSLNSLVKRLKVVGIGADVLDEVRSRGLAYYDSAWAEYEGIHNEEHPYRFFDQMAAVGS